MRVLAISVTERGRATATRLPYERHHGQLAATLKRRWADVDAFVLLVAVGAAVRALAPLLGSKGGDPGVVCLDEAGRHAVAVLGGHAGGANALAREVAALTGADAVVTTATDATSVVALDGLPGLVAHGDVAGVTASLLAGGRPLLVRRLPWPLPRPLVDACDPGPVAVPPPTRERPVVVVSDESLADLPGRVTLCPPSLVAGVGSSSDATASELEALLEEVLAGQGLDRRSLGRLATIDRRVAHPAIEALSAGLGLPVTGLRAEELREVEVSNPSAAVERAVGTPSVAEAAALLAAGPGGRLVVGKRASARATVALARMGAPRGSLLVVGLGPGGASLRAPAASAAVRNASVVIGYGAYVDSCSELLDPSKEVLRSPIGAEVERARAAVERASAGHAVAVVSSGDAGVYAMASLVLEEAGEAPPFDLEVVPGITASLAAAALLGAPLGHDHAVVSLSDLLTPWELIEARVRAAAEADLVLALYNPRSARRTWQLEAVRHLLLERRGGSTPVGVVRAAGRPESEAVVTTLEELDCGSVDMSTCLIVGSSRTRIVAGRMVTPRGYRDGSGTRSDPGDS